MNPTLKVAALTSPPPSLTIDEALAINLTSGQMAVLAAYVSVCGGSLLSWYARGVG